MTMQKHVACRLKLQVVLFVFLMLMIQKTEGILKEKISNQKISSNKLPSVKHDKTLETTENKGKLILEKSDSTKTQKEAPNEKLKNKTESQSTGQGSEDFLSGFFKFFEIFKDVHPSSGKVLNYDQIDYPTDTNNTTTVSESPANLPQNTSLINNTKNSNHTNNNSNNNSNYSSVEFLQLSDKSGLKKESRKSDESIEKEKYLLKKTKSQHNKKTKITEDPEPSQSNDNTTPAADTNAPAPTDTNQNSSENQENQSAHTSESSSSETEKGTSEAATTSTSESTAEASEISTDSPSKSEAESTATSPDSENSDSSPENTTTTTTTETTSDQINGEPATDSAKSESVTSNSSGETKPTEAIPDVASSEAGNTETSSTETVKVEATSPETTETTNPEATPAANPSTTEAANPSTAETATPEAATPEAANTETVSPEVAGGTSEQASEQSTEQSNSEATNEEGKTEQADKGSQTSTDTNVSNPEPKKTEPEESTQPIEPVSQEEVKEAESPVPVPDNSTRIEIVEPTEEDKNKAYGLKEEDLKRIVNSESEQIKEKLTENKEEIVKEVQQAHEETKEEIKQNEEAIKTSINDFSDKLDKKLGKIDEEVKDNVRKTEEISVLVLEDEIERKEQKLKCLLEEIKTLIAELPAPQSVCDRYAECKECTANPSCGWCPMQKKCVEGDSVGPLFEACTFYNYHYCSGGDCVRYNDCESCLASPYCGWCADEEHGVETCIEEGPEFQGCNNNFWFHSKGQKDRCPIKESTTAKSEIAPENDDYLNQGEGLKVNPDERALEIRKKQQLLVKRKNEADSLKTEIIILREKLKKVARISEEEEKAKELDQLAREEVSVGDQVAKIVEEVNDVKGAGKENGQGANGVGSGELNDVKEPGDFDFKQPGEPNDFKQPGEPTEEKAPVELNDAKGSEEENGLEELNGEGLEKEASKQEVALRPIPSESEPKNIEEDEVKRGRSVSKEGKLKVNTKVEATGTPEKEVAITVSEDDIASVLDSGLEQSLIKKGNKIDLKSKSKLMKNKHSQFAFLFL